ncbi:MAG: hypothetical protein K2N94_07765 [Lachnospiraceae bacterium]|nr:hypothetical protein [Lachnospiraceae bacterium]
MKRRQKYFLWNSRQSFERGQGRNIRITKGGLVPGKGGCAGIYYTGLCDSGRALTEWDRLALEGEIPRPERVRICIYTSEEPFLLVRGRRFELDRLLGDTSMPAAQKDELLESCKRQELFWWSSQRLRGVTGRYLWLRVQMEGAEEELCIRRMQIFFPRAAWTAFLPELYRGQEDSFLERFLGIFQWMYEEMDRKIEKLPGLYCADSSPAELLVWLSEWTGIEEPQLWGEAQLRYLIRHGAQLAGLRGTREYMRRLLWLYTGVSPYIVEYWQWAYEEPDGRRRNLLERLYGSDSFCAAVIFPGRVLKNRDCLPVLERLVQCSSPAYMEVKIEILQPRIFLDRHSYLGINSYLESWGGAALDGQSYLPCTVWKEGRHEG